jgi:fused signal recognition particle receptor
VAFDAVEAASARGIDVVLVDTAGRLHTHDDLMQELKKIVRVVSRKREGAPHECLLVLDGTVGQNALQQGRTFAESVPITGLVITKLDGTAKGGSVLTLRRELEIPIRFLGVGEGLDDLEVFDAEAFVERLLSD